jgi:hypothetical protein
MVHDEDAVICVQHDIRPILKTIALGLWPHPDVRVGLRRIVSVELYLWSLSVAAM